MCPLRFWRNLMLVTVILMGCWKTSEGYPAALDQEMDQSQKEPDDALWILMQDHQPFPHLEPSLAQVLHTRNGKPDQFQSNDQPSLDDTSSSRNRFLNKGFSTILQEAFRDDNSGRETSFRMPPNTWARTVNKRGIGLFSLAVALAQNNAPSFKPRMQPVDLSAYPRRARFFVASMG